ncbi:PTPA-domain-containing protein [Dothidotthia symphoricarpi CBS 119687]|uniref:Serine/threonine-protein phosphatase 2A activator n=1 Tax=Dothidotthia symphoricarpi CBS 119687 TaxID=1392245 RepID=A0A6A5ZZ13_9PLEO|nr:PTPA-domain-containing protein [Dothidotthia symphoricarpi CBS 119687]KAF2123997.1 PTPA-domain-containing protein [Dothidotthia symphoricarpi CBS 119687]
MPFQSLSTCPTLDLLHPDSSHGFTVPTKRINDGDDVTFFLASKAYADIMTFMFQLNISMIPRRITNEEQSIEFVKEWRLQDLDVPHPPVVQSIAKLLDVLGAVVNEAPPDTGPRRFGNVAFRTWYDIVRERVSDLLDRYLPAEVLAFKSSSDVSAKDELEAYLLGSFGSSQRLDYGTGHELSFLAFLGCLWKLGAFPESEDGDQERGIVLGIIEPYLVLIRRLILTYTLEPAGSHGVWGLDDHFFLSYIFGSAQFSPSISTLADVTTEGSLPDAPNPADVAKANAVERERKRNMYFSAIGFIYDVKTGPFWEHSPILYDISGVKAGWAKINKGMIKMYNAEVLSKFPVVQHFPFGSLFPWTPDPSAITIEASVHTSSQPKAATPSSTAPTARPQPGLRDPMADMSSGIPSTSAPWANSRSSPSLPITSARHPPRLEPLPLRAQPSPRNPMANPANGMPATRAPWESGRITSCVLGPSEPDLPTQAPWATRTPIPPRTSSSVPSEANPPLSAPPSEPGNAAWARSVPHAPLSEASMKALRERGRAGSLAPDAAPLRKGGEVGLEEDARQGKDQSEN